MKIIIVYNNEARQGFKSGWGFSCLVEENQKKILFDTGDNPKKLLYNLKKLKIDPAGIDFLVISHEHWDHTGGLKGILENNPDIKILMPDSPEPVKITNHILTTGAIKNSPDEQSLILKTNKGITVIVGCSHPGVDKILNIAEKYGKIHAIIGGFHGFSNFDSLKNIEIIGACHCTQHADKIKELYPKQFKEIKAGDIIEI